MPDNRKQVLLRIDKELYDQVKAMAEFYGGRTINATIVRYIRMGLTVDEGVNAAGRDTAGQKGGPSD